MELEIASKINLDSIVRKIMENEIGILLLKTDGGCVFDIIASESCYKDRLGISHAKNLKSIKRNRLHA